MTARSAPVPLPDPPLSGAGFVLRPWSVVDAAVLALAWADPEVARWTGVPARPDEATARRWITGDADRRARGLSLDLVIDVDGSVAGEVGLAAIDVATRSAEIGWWVAPTHRGRGLATAAAGVVASWAVEELCIDHVLARCALGNPASGGVARAAGFHPVGAPGAGLWRFTASSGATLGV
jgi:RimJ/RimL family protein N-acetyltransferase